MTSTKDKASSIFSALSDDVAASPYLPKLYLTRAEWLSAYGLHDLAAGDAYKALLLSDEIQDEAGEYHEEVCNALLESSRH